MKARQVSYALGRCVRVGVVSDTCFRVEFSPSGRFEDRASVVVARRLSSRSPPVATAVRSGGGGGESGAGLELTTRRVRLRVRLAPDATASSSSSSFSSVAALSVELLSPQQRTLWPQAPLQQPPPPLQQLLLSGANGGQSAVLRAWEQAEDAAATTAAAALGGVAHAQSSRGAFVQGRGVLSRAGMTVLDDSATPLLTTGGAGGALEVVPRANEPHYVDAYVLCFGDDFAAALRDFATLCGDVPLPPRWAFGLWWTPASLGEAQSDGVAFRTHCGVSPAVVVVPAADAPRSLRTAERIPLPPPPRVLLTAVVPSATSTTHPAAALRAGDVGYSEVASAVGSEQQQKQQSPIPLVFNNVHLALAYRRYVLGGLAEKGAAGFFVETAERFVAPTSVHVIDVHRPRDSDMVVCAPWSGMGTHRSATVVRPGMLPARWDVLRALPEFLCSAGNACCFYYAPDVGGSLESTGDAELFQRWVQFAALSPIFCMRQSHGESALYDDRRPWMHDAETLRIVSRALMFRRSLSPYLWATALRTRNTSAPFVQAMYFVHPKLHHAWHCPHQYMLGAELLVSPFLLPGDSSTRLSRQVVWIPPGLWYDLFSGCAFHGNTWHALYGEPDETPVFAKAGAIIPLLPETCCADESVVPTELDLVVFPGENKAGIELWDADPSSCSCHIALHRAFEGRVALLMIDQQSLSAPARAITAYFRCISRPELFAVELDSVDITETTGFSYDEETFTATVGPMQIPAGSCVLGVRLEGASAVAPELLQETRISQSIDKMLLRFSAESGLRQRVSAELKAALAHARQKGESVASAMLNTILEGTAQELPNKAQVRALVEVFCSCGCVAFDSGMDVSRRRHVVAWNNESLPEMVLSIPKPQSLAGPAPAAAAAASASASPGNESSDTIQAVVPSDGFSAEIDPLQSMPLFFDYGAACRIRVGAAEPVVYQGSAPDERARAPASEQGVLADLLRDATKTTADDNRAKLYRAATSDVLVTPRIPKQHGGGQQPPGCVVC